MTHGCQDFRTTRKLSRRSVLRVGTAGIAGLGLPGLLRAEAPRASESGHAPAPKAKHVIFLHQFGGPSHVDIV